MSELEDIKLRALLQEMKLNSPQKDFSIKVMNRIFEEDNVFEKIRKEKIFGTGFWIILILFLGLFAAMLVMSGSGAESDGKILNFLPEINPEISSRYYSVFEKMGTVPLSIAGILLASSILLFIDRFITVNSKLFQHN